MQATDIDIAAIGLIGSRDDIHGQPRHHRLEPGTVATFHADAQIPEVGFERIEQRKLVCAGERQRPTWPQKAAVAIAGGGACSQGPDAVVKGCTCGPP